MDNGTSGADRVPKKTEGKHIDLLLDQTVLHSGYNQSSLRGLLNQRFASQVPWETHVIQAPPSFSLIGSDAAHEQKCNT